MSEEPIYIEVVSAPTNIACIKYWGKASVEYNTPINSSVSVTLDQNDLKAVTTIAISKRFESNRLWLNGTEEDVSSSKRFTACLNGIKSLAQDKTVKTDDGQEVVIKKEDLMQMNVHVSSYNTFPTAAGLASSAAGYAALVACMAQVFNAKEEYVGQLSTIARQGSGSACRSLYGGFVAWRMGSAEGMDAYGPWSNSMAEQICDENHWPELRALILVVSDAKKDTSSTSGMKNSVNTSTLLDYRANKSNLVNERMDLISKAYKEKDFAAFGEVTMKDSNQFHATCLDTYPPIFYMNDISKTIIKIVHKYNEFYKELRVAYTFDAGPNAVLYTLDKYVVEIGSLMLYYYPEGCENYVNNTEYYNQIKDHKVNEELRKFVGDVTDFKANDVKMFYYTKCGPGPTKLSLAESTIDPKTGLNTYQP